jgi:hypothetical protein
VALSGALDGTDVPDYKRFAASPATNSLTLPGAPRSIAARS